MEWHVSRIGIAQGPLHGLLGQQRQLEQRILLRGSELAVRPGPAWILRVALAVERRRQHSVRHLERGAAQPGGHPAGADHRRGVRRHDQHAVHQRAGGGHEGDAHPRHRYQSDLHRRADGGTARVPRRLPEQGAALPRRAVGRGHLEPSRHECRKEGVPLAEVQGGRRLQDGARRRHGQVPPVPERRGRPRVDRRPARGDQALRQGLHQGQAWQDRGQEHCAPGLLPRRRLGSRERLQVRLPRGLPRGPPVPALELRQSAQHLVRPQPVPAEGGHLRRGQQVVRQDGVQVRPGLHPGRRCDGPPRLHHQLPQQREHHRAAHVQPRAVREGSREAVRRVPDQRRVCLPAGDQVHVPHRLLR
mmetsp:Transcript_4320/g.11721  ORF Transcript_4320/g.11721 Transcript_4320/m.11721 type:complete len:360 (+) Transcript_4320:7368-8447(+)